MNGFVALLLSSPFLPILHFTSEYINVFVDSRRLCAFIIFNWGFDVWKSDWHCKSCWREDLNRYLWDAVIELVR